MRVRLDLRNASRRQIPTEEIEESGRILAVLVWTGDLLTDFGLGFGPGPDPVRVRRLQTSDDRDLRPVIR
jgi:hypothetical protein